MSSLEPTIDSLEPTIDSLEPTIDNLSAGWVHDWDPFIFSIGDDIGLRWYGMAYLAGILAGLVLMRRWISQRRLPLLPAWLSDAGLWIGMAMIVGARLGYCLFYDQSLLGFSARPPFWQVLMLWRGGMSSHGGAFGLFVGTLWYARRYRVNNWVIADAVGTVAPIGVICGRLANFINGELWGRVTEPFWAAVKFPAAFAQDLQLRLAAGELHPEQANDLWQTYDALPPYSPQMTAFIAEHGLWRHPSQLYAVGLEGLLVLMVALVVHARHRRPGLSLAAVIITYGIGRMISEGFRQPDEGYELFFGWMSKGQALSVPMIVAGLALAVWTWRRGPRPQSYQPPAEAT